eukprot:tig00000704_g3301.t1
MAICIESRKLYMHGSFARRARLIMNSRDAGRDAAASLGHAHAAGPRPAGPPGDPDHALAAKARQRLAAAREALAALEA